MSARWSLRKSGQVRTTVCVNYHVPKDLVDWMHEHAGMNERQALAFIRSHIGKLADGWYTVSIRDGALEVDTVDSCREYAEEIDAFYEGPAVA